MVKAREFPLGKGAPAESSRVREPRRTALLRGQSWAHGNGVSSWLSLASHLVWSMFVLTQVLPGGWQPSSQDDSSAKDSGRLIRHLMGWHLSSILLVPPRSSQLVFSGAAPCSLSRPPIVRQLMQVVVIMPIKAGSFGHQPDTDA